MKRVALNVIPADSVNARNFRVTDFPILNNTNVKSQTDLIGFLVLLVKEIP